MENQYPGCRLITKKAWHLLKCHALVNGFINLKDHKSSAYQINLTVRASKVKAKAKEKVVVEIADHCVLLIESAKVRSVFNAVVIV